MQRIFIAGMPRSGSMWTYNIARNLIRASGHTLIPELVPSNEEELIQKYAASDRSDADFLCIKTHALLTPLDSTVKIICNYRDVRDAMISFMKFTHTQFEMGIEVAKRMMHTTDHYFQVGTQENTLRIRYESLVESNFHTAQLINEFLNLNVAEEDVNKLIQDYSRENIRDKFSQFDLSKNQNLQDRKNLRSEIGASEIDLEKYDIVRNFDNSYRLYERETGFQSNHVTNTKTKEWRKILSISQQKSLIEITSDWLNSYGYRVL